MTLKTTGILFYAPERFVHHSIATCEFDLIRKRRNRGHTGNLWPVRSWNGTDNVGKKNRSLPICPAKLWASFYNHLWIVTGVITRKRWNWDQIGCIGPCDLKIAVITFDNIKASLLSALNLYVLLAMAIIENCSNPGRLKFWQNLVWNMWPWALTYYLGHYFRQW